MSREERRRLKLTPAEQKLLASVDCPDCDSEVHPYRDSSGVLNTEIRHDDTCPQLTFRQRHGMTHQFMVDPRGASPEALAEFMQALADNSAGLRVAVDPADASIGATERAFIDEVDP